MIVSEIDDFKVDIVIKFQKYITLQFAILISKFVRKKFIFISRGLRFLHKIYIGHEFLFIDLLKIN